MDEITRQVRELYTRYPFPSKDKIENELPSYLPEVVKRFFNTREKNRQKLSGIIGKLLPEGLDTPHVLEAGCGTGEDLLEIARALPNASIVAIDLSPTSLEKARKLLEREGQERVGFLEHDLMQPCPFEDDRFHAIVSIGVIHHLSDPVVGFRHLARVLSPEGHLICYLYGHLGRQDLIWKRELVDRLAGKDADFEDKIHIVNALDLYPRRHQSSFKEVMYGMLGFDRQTTRDVWIVDQLAHVREKEYTVSVIEEDLEAAGLELGSFIGFPNSLDEVITDEKVLSRAKDLERSAQYRILELLLRPTGYLFTARRKR